MSNKERKNPVKIMVFGTFDGLHKGHLHFFKQARALSTDPFLVVSIARDKNVKKIKGTYPTFNENVRARLVSKAKLVDKVVISGIKNHLPHILREKPEIIALGYDQREYVRNLKKDLGIQGLKIRLKRLKPYKKNIYKNHLLKKKRIF